MQFLFLAKTITKPLIDKIKIDNDEIVGFKFAGMSEAKKILNLKIVKRLNVLNGNYKNFVMMENMEKIL